MGKILGVIVLFQDNLTHFCPKFIGFLKKMAFWNIFADLGQNGKAWLPLIFIYKMSGSPGFFCFLFQCFIFFFLHYFIVRLNFELIKVRFGEFWIDNSELMNFELIDFEFINFELLDFELIKVKFGKFWIDEFWIDRFWIHKFWIIGFWID